MAKIDNPADAAIKPLYGILMKMCGRTGYTPDAVFEGLLDYIIGFLNPSLKPEPIEGWKFKPQDTETFCEMFRTVCQIYEQEIPRRGWYDPFGDLYMAIHAGGGGKGQFFTPPSVAQVVAETNLSGWSEPKGQSTPFGHRITINDCAAGSGRMPLAGYSVILRKMQEEWGYNAVQTEARRPFISCEDLDYNCVKMSAINMAFHGCFGEAVCHDTLCEPDKVRLGYIVNETMWPFPTGIPSIRKEMNPLKFVCTRLWAALNKAEHNTENEAEQVQKCEVDCKKDVAAPPLPDPVQPKEKPKGQPVQLTLF